MLFFFFEVVFASQQFVCQKFDQTFYKLFHSFTRCWSCWPNLIQLPGMSRRSNPWTGSFSLRSSLLRTVRGGSPTRRSSWRTRWWRGCGSTNTGGRFTSPSTRSSFACRTTSTSSRSRWISGRSRNDSTTITTGQSSITFHKLQSLKWIYLIF